MYFIWIEIFSFLLFFSFFLALHGSDYISIPTHWPNISLPTQMPDFFPSYSDTRLDPFQFRCPISSLSTPMPDFIPSYSDARLHPFLLRCPTFYLPTPMPEFIPSYSDARIHSFLLRCPTFSLPTPMPEFIPSNSDARLHPFLYRRENYKIVSFHLFDDIREQLLLHTLLLFILCDEQTIITIKRLVFNEH